MTLITLPWKRAVVGLVFLTAGCNGPSSRSLPSTPSALPSVLAREPTAPTAPSVPAPTNPSSASVIVKNPFAIVHRDGSRFGYEVRFLLQETSGASGATIERVVVYGPSGSDETNRGCWGDTLRLPAGGELDTFYTDAGAAWLLYRGPGSGGSTASPTLYVVVTFTDDHGVGGAVGVPISTLR